MRLAKGAVNSVVESLLLVELVSVDLSDQVLVHSQSISLKGPCKGLAVPLLSEGLFFSDKFGYFLGNDQQLKMLGKNLIVQLNPIDNLVLSATDHIPIIHDHLILLSAAAETDVRTHGQSLKGLLLLALKAEALHHPLIAGLA